MKVKTAKILGILFSAFFAIMLVSCGLLGENGDEQAVTINLPHLANASSRSIARDDIGRLREDTRKYRVTFQTSSGSVVREGTGGAFSAYFAVGTEISVTVECLNGNGDVILRTVTKSIVVSSGQNSVSFNLMTDGTEITPSAPPSPAIEYVNITFNQGFVYTNTLHLSPSTWQGMTGASLPSSGQREKGSSVSADQASATGYVFKGWVENNVQPSGDAPDTQSFNYVQNYSDNMALYAIWEQLETGSHSVMFAGGTTTGSVVSGLPQGFQQQEIVQATFSGTPTCPGYEFTGWSSNVSGVTVTQAGNDWSFTMPASDVTLTAQWALNQYNITYGDTNGGTGSADTTGATTSFNIETQNITLATVGTLEKIGDQFEGWETSDGTDVRGMSAAQLIALITSGDTLALRAKWIAGKRTVLYADGTLIINEAPNARRTNIGVTDVYAAMEDNGSNYVFAYGDYGPWYSNKDLIKYVEIGSAISPISTSCWFKDMSVCTSISLTNLNASNVTDMSYMFDGCSSLTSLYFEDSFYTSKVTDMFNMFDGCSSLGSLDLSSFATSGVTDMSGVFYSCSRLTSLDLSSFSTSGADKPVMFMNCSSLVTIYASNNFIASGDSDPDMFSGCISLVGGRDTRYDPSNIDGTYGRIDGGPGSLTPGYFTQKP